MSCKIASSNTKSSFNLFTTKSNRSTKTHIPESISFNSQFTGTRISITTNPSMIAPPRIGARPAAALHAPPAECGESLYELLGIGESGSTLSDIKKAYKKMARKYHPDVSPPDRVDEHTRRFVMVKEAYEILSNPQMRASYDRDLSKGLGFGLSARKPHQYHQKMEEKREWKIRWQSQLDELKKKKKSKNLSWGARMRAQT